MLLSLWHQYEAHRSGVLVYLLWVSVQQGFEHNIQDARQENFR